MNAHLASLGFSSIDTAHPVIGIYGKMGAVKGTFDILAALTRLKREGSGSRCSRPHTAPPTTRPLRARRRSRRSDRSCTAGALSPSSAHAVIPSRLLDGVRAGTGVSNRGARTGHADRGPRVWHAAGRFRGDRSEADLRSPPRSRPQCLDRPRSARHRRAVIGAARGARGSSALSALGLRGARIIGESVSATDRIRLYEGLFAAAVDGTHASADGSPIDSEDGEGLGEEELSWAALQKPHPAIATSDVLDVLLYRGLDASEPEPASIPALAPTWSSGLFHGTWTRTT